MKPGGNLATVDRQIERIEADLLASDDLERQILADLDRSREASKVITTASPGMGGALSPDRVVRQQSISGYADPGLYAALQRNQAWRRQLRADLVEMIELRARLAGQSAPALKRATVGLIKRRT